ncbi:hypothetical protein AYI68_g1749, partial [Smittium mucronatum]
KQSLDTESRHRIEQAVAYKQLKVEMAMECEQLAVKEASLYKRLMELQIDSSRTETTIGQTSLRNIPKIRSFNGQPISFNRWIFGVDELFTNYPGLSDFQKHPVVAAIKSEDTAPYSTAQYSSQFNRHFYPATPRFNSHQYRNPFQLITKPHSRENTTMRKAQLEDYVRNSQCYKYGQKGNFRSSCTKPPGPTRLMKPMLFESLDEEKDNAQ